MRLSSRFRFTRIVEVGWFVREWSRLVGETGVKAASRITFTAQ